MPALPKGVEFKTFPFQLTDVKEQPDTGLGIVTGFLSVFGNVDSHKDRVIKGAFKKTIGEAKSRMETKNKRFLWPMLWMHSPDQPIGGFVDAKETDHGLLVQAQLDISTNAAGFPNNPLATMVYSGFKSGYIDEFSMGYRPLQKDYDQAGVRELKECQMIEGSAITSMFASNDEALLTSVKSVLDESDALEQELKVGRRFSAASLNAISEQIDKLEATAASLKKLIAPLIEDEQQEQAEDREPPKALTPEAQPEPKATEASNFELAMHAWLSSQQSA